MFLARSMQITGRSFSSLSSLTSLSSSSSSSSCRKLILQPLTLPHFSPSFSSFSSFSTLSSFSPSSSSSTLQSRLLRFMPHNSKNITRRISTRISSRLSTRISSRISSRISTRISSRISARISQSGAIIKPYHQRLIRYPVRMVSSSSRNQGNAVLVRLVARLAGRLFGHAIRKGWFRRYPWIWALLTLPVIGLAAAALMHLERVPVTNRYHIVWLSSEAESRLARDADEEIFQLEEANILPDNDDTVLMVTDMVNEIVEICREQGLVPSNLSNFKVHVIDKDIANAFVLPNGSIYVYTGLFPVAQTVGGLACVLGHEVSHALARHTAEKIGVLNMLLTLYEFLRGLSEGYAGRHSWQRLLVEFVGATLLQVTFPLAHSRKMENEADRIGLIISTRAGYDPRHAADLWKRMATMSTAQAKVNQDLAHTLASSSDTSSSDTSASDTLSSDTSSSDTSSSSSQTSSSLSGTKTISKYFKTRFAELASTHPSHDRRIQNLNSLAVQLIAGGEVMRSHERLHQKGRNVPNSDALIKDQVKYGDKTLYDLFSPERNSNNDDDDDDDDNKNPSSGDDEEDEWKRNEDENPYHHGELPEDDIFLRLRVLSLRNAAQNGSAEELELERQALVARSAALMVGQTGDDLEMLLRMMDSDHK